jgi:hypothetical protein
MLLEEVLGAMGNHSMKILRNLMNVQICGWLGILYQNGTKDNKRKDEFKMSVMKQT